MKIFAHYLLRQNEETQFYIDKNKVIEVDEIGLIRKISDKSDNDKINIELKGLTSPAFVNSHSHAFQISMRGKADNPKNFKDWVQRYLYPTVKSFSEKELRKTYQIFFKELLRNGIASLGEFHYFHHEKENDFKFDQIFLEEAYESGIRLSLLQSAYDLGAYTAQKRFHSSVELFLKSLKNIEEWFIRNKMNKDWSISVAPHSLHGASADLIKESVSWAYGRDLNWHIHLAEQKDDINFSLNKYQKTPLLALEELLKEKLNSNASLVHACWLSADEINLFNERKLNLIYNPMTNMYLGDGVTKLSEFNFSKSKIALGTDSNNAFNMPQEAKTAELIQRLSHHEMGIIDPNILYASITSYSGELLNLNVGKIEENYFADMIEIDIEKMVDVSLADLTTEEVLNHLIFSGFESKFIKKMMISGKEKDIH